jgi:predicted transcriptional regulator
MTEALKKPEPMNNEEYVKLTAEIVAGVVQHKSIDDLPAFMKEVYNSLVSLDTKEVPNLKGAVPNVLKKTAKQLYKETVTPDYIVCLEDGKKLKMLKRHLKAFYQMTPAEYREKWGLDADYPFTAPNHSKRRIEIAKSVKLGTVGRKKKTDVENVQGL